MDATGMRIFRLWWWRDIRFAIKERWQRLTRGFSGSEWWEFHSSASKWMLPRLKYLREHKHGYPCTMFPDDVELDSDTSQEVCEAAAKKWDDIMGEMIWALEFYAEEPEWTTHEDYMVLYNRANAGMVLLATYWGALWD
jgi:hypothetical protein